jgi:hypothetical protein
MRVRLSDPDLLLALLSFLRERLDCVAVDAGDGMIAVSLLGSRHVAENVAELEERLVPWRALNAGVRVELAVAS